MQGDDPSRRSSNGKQLDDLAKSQVSYATNEQDGKRSELGTAMPLPEVRAELNLHLKRII